MGTGKTAVGKTIARQLGRPFVDMDTEIEARAGKSVPRIFAEQGESAFRRLEATLCRELSAQRGLVIATGGGALVDGRNRELMMETGLVICLDASPEAILDRVSDNEHRPLLHVSDPRSEIDRLLATRRDAYEAIPWHIETTDLSPEEVASHVRVLAEASALPVRYPGGKYDVYVGEGMLDHVGGTLRAAGVPGGVRIALVSNDVVAPLYAARVELALRTVGFQPFACIIPDGERHKTLATAASLYDLFLAGGLDRSGLVLSLGGGVTGDIAGFATASFMRGVAFAQVPTTLLSMVDASVGGKTGVDLPQGKNLVGAFKQPTAVVIDPDVLATLDAAEFRSGMAEVIKHGFIGAPDLIADLTEEGSGARPAMTSAQIARALRVKIEVVEADPYEEGERAVLNLGHTIGHALEKLSRYQLRHGEAVSIGMVAAARIAAALGRAEPGLPGRIEDTLAAWDLPVRCPPYSVAAIWQALAHDKKRRGDRLRWILPTAMGDTAIVADVPEQTILAVLHEMGAEK
jgi:3-dehydroquinate synthase